MEIPRSLYHKSGEIDPEETKEISESNKQLESLFATMEENIKAVKNIDNKIGSALSEEEKDKLSGEREKLFNEGQKLGEEFGELAKEIIKRKAQNKPWANKLFDFLRQ